MSWKKIATTERPQQLRFSISREKSLTRTAAKISAYRYTLSLLLSLLAAVSFSSRNSRTERAAKLSKWISRRQLTLRPERASRISPALGILLRLSLMLSLSLSLGWSSPSRPGITLLVTLLYLLLRVSLLSLCCCYGLCPGCKVPISNVDDCTAHTARKHYIGIYIKLTE